MRLPLENTASENPWCSNACSEPPKRVAKTEWLGQGGGMQGRAGMCIFRGVDVMKMLDPPPPQKDLPSVSRCSNRCREV